MAGSGNSPTIVKTLSYETIISSVVSPTVVRLPLTGLGPEYLQGWYIFIDTTNDSGSAPKGDYILCTDYNQLTGQCTFSRPPNGNPFAQGQIVKMMHPSLVSGINVAVLASDNVKQTFPTSPVTTAAAIYTRVASMAFTGAVGSGRVKFNLRSNNIGGTAQAVIRKNGIPVITNPSGVPNFTVWTAASNVDVPVTQDVGGLSVGDTVEIWALVAAPATQAIVSNFTIGYDVLSLPSVQSLSNIVYFDSVNGVSGTDWPIIGSIEQPVNNIPDLISIINQWHIKDVKLVNGVITIPFDLSGLHFIGNDFADPTMAFVDNVIELNSFTLRNCSFENISINNTAGGNLDTCGPFNACSWIFADSGTNLLGVYKSFVFIPLLITCNGFFDSQVTAGQMIGCSVFNFTSFNTTVTMDSCFVFLNCIWLSGGNILSQCFDFDSCTFQQVSIFTACVEFRNVTFVEAVTLDCTGIASPGVFNINGAPVTFINIAHAAISFNVSGECEVTVDASCTGGTATFYGLLKLINNTGGTVVVDNTILGNGATVANLAVPAPDSVANILERDVIGNKADAAQIVVGVTRSIMAYVKGLLNQVATLVTNVDPKVAGRLQTTPKTFDLNQAAATYDLFTGTAQDVLIDSLTFRVPLGAVGGAVTFVSIQTNDATPTVFISAVDGAVANLTSEISLSWVPASGKTLLKVGKKIQLTIAGGAAGVAKVTDIVVDCHAVVAGGYLA